MEEIKTKYDWAAIQDYSDRGHTWRDIFKKFSISAITLKRATDRGYFKSARDKSEAAKLHVSKFGTAKHSEETKRKISEKRTQYLIANPDKVPYKINHSSKKSWPEQVFENALKASGITGWTYAHQNGIYEYDFAWTEQKIDVEIDGATHDTEKVKQIDERRDKFSKENGWTVIRFKASDVKKDVMGCIKKLLSYGVPQEGTVVRRSKTGDLFRISLFAWTITNGQSDGSWFIIVQDYNRVISGQKHILTASEFLRLSMALINDQPFAFWLKGLNEKTTPEEVADFYMKTFIDK